MSYHRKGMGFFVPGAVVAATTPETTLPPPQPAYSTAGPPPKCPANELPLIVNGAWKCSPPTGSAQLPTQAVATKPPPLSKGFMLAIGATLLVGGYLLTRK